MEEKTMKNTGMTRPLDPLGRVVLPKELRTVLDIPVGTPMQVFTNGAQIMLRKHSSGCVFCGELENLQTFKEVEVCQSCRTALTDMLE
jgi:transcriptional pleiotropic regulator of transition state genes